MLTTAPHLESKGKAKHPCDSPHRCNDERPNPRAPPTITITDYLHRIALHTTLEPSTLLSMVYYIDLLSGHYPAFTISSLTVHRFLITAATVASKGLCDSFCTNTFYARVGGISLRELNVLELEFLSRVGWKIVPQPEVLREYYVRLVRRMGDGWGFEDGPDSDGSTDFFLGRQQRSCVDEPVWIRGLKRFAIKGLFLVRECSNCRTARQRCGRRADRNDLRRVNLIFRRHVSLFSRSESGPRIKSTIKSHLLLLILV